MAQMVPVEVDECAMVVSVVAVVTDGTKGNLFDRTFYLYNKFCQHVR